jgi:hypothetical protein
MSEEIPNAKMPNPKKIPKFEIPTGSLTLGVSLEFGLLGFGAL